MVHVCQVWIALGLAVDPARAPPHHWMCTSVECKDVLVLAMPIKEFPPPPRRRSAPLGRTNLSSLSFTSCALDLWMHRTGDSSGY